MVREVIWRDEALADLEAIKDYIARDSLIRAEEVVAAFEESR